VAKESARRDARLRKALVELGDCTRILVHEQNARRKAEEDLGACRAQLADRQILWEDALLRIQTLEHGESLFHMSSVALLVRKCHYSVCRLGQ
jgi:hypothetical protein